MKKYLLITHISCVISIFYKQLTETVTALEVVYMANNTYFRIYSNLSNCMHNTAWDEIQKVGVGKRKLAIKSGDVDEDGVPFITVDAGGQWSKRFYKTKYDVLSGVVTLLNIYIVYFFLLKNVNYF